MFSFRYAEQVLIGDEVLVQGKNELAPVKVINVFNLKMQGNHHILTCSSSLHLLQ